ncbi:hypothetical protein [Desulfoscipio sp. XC116]|uniref:hypothetical protein n=1 Tax=Desulfoscipio sp. XC116 TaxID=3144975 RepID=UPI00325B4D5C
MRKKFLFTVMLTIAFCFSLVLVVSAGQPTAKDLVMTAVKNIDFGINKGFYEKCQGESHLTLTKFDGSLLEEAGDFAGAKVDFLTQLDNPNNAIKVDYNASIKGNTHKGAVYLKDDKLILTRDILGLLQEFGIDDASLSMDKAPAYLYLSNEQLGSIWEQVAAYQNQQVPQEYKDMLLFIVEAVPEEYFSISSAKVVVKLDQAGFETTIFNLLTKIKNEPERIADIIVNANKYNCEQLDTTPAEMRQEIISGIEDATFPTREEIKTISSFLEVEDFTYEKSILPGGPQKFNVRLNIKTPDDSVNGRFTMAVDTVGDQENKEGSYQITGGFDLVDGPKIDFAFDADYNYQDTVAYSGGSINVTAKDNTTGESMLDLGLTSDSVSEVDDSLVITAPVLTSDNSMDITGLISSFDQAVDVQATDVGEPVSDQAADE